MRLPRVEDFEPRLRGPATASRVGIWLGIAFGICFLTGIWSHLQQDTPDWLTVPTSPAWLYRVTQGLHVTTGVASVPLLLVKLWSVYPRLFKPLPLPGRTSGRTLVVEGLERASIGVLVAAAVFELSSGLLNIVQWYPWEFSFRVTHFAVAWIAIGALLVHIAVKLPIIREALLGPIDAHDDEHDDGAPPAAGPSRRILVRSTLGASAVAVLLTAGQSVTPLRRISVLGVRDGDGPQDLPVNRTARAAGATAAALDPDWTLTVVNGDTSRTFTRDDLLAMPQETHRLPIACVEGWSRSADWTGVPVRELVRLVGAPADSVVGVDSLQTRGAFSRTELPAQFVADERTLLALALNGETLALDHGFPCRIIAPNRPGVLQTKWVTTLEVRA